MMVENPSVSRMQGGFIRKGRSAPAYRLSHRSIPKKRRSATWISSFTAKIEAYISANRAAIVEDLKTLVRIRSVSENGSGDKPFGEGCAKVLSRAVEMAHEKGLTAQSHGGYYGTVTWGEGDKTIGIFSHLDVVPEGNGWQYDPYNPVEKDGYLIGRGATDNKSAAVLGMHVMKCLESLDVPFRSKVSLFMGCSEETGMDDIARYVQGQPCLISPCAGYPISPFAMVKRESSR